MPAILGHERNRILFRVKLTEWRAEESIGGLHEIVHLDEHAQSGIAFRPEMAKHGSARDSRDRAVAGDEIEKLHFGRVEG